MDAYSKIRVTRLYALIKIDIFFYRQETFSFIYIYTSKMLLPFSLSFNFSF